MSTEPREQPDVSPCMYMLQARNRIGRFLEVLLVKSRDNTLDGNADQAHRGAERGRLDAQLRRRAAGPPAAATAAAEADEAGAGADRALLPQPRPPRLPPLPGTGSLVGFSEIKSDLSRISSNLTGFIT